MIYLQANPLLCRWKIGVARYLGIFNFLEIPERLDVLLPPLLTISAK